MGNRAVEDLNKLRNEYIMREDKKENYIIELRQREKNLTSKKAKRHAEIVIEKEVSKLMEIKRIKGEITDILNRLAPKWRENKND